MTPVTQFYVGIFVAGVTALLFTGSQVKGIGANLLRVLRIATTPAALSGMTLRVWPHLYRVNRERVALQSGAR